MQQNQPTYIVAVSGGVDSSVLLHQLVNHDQAIAKDIPTGSVFIVAHVNHGMRGASSNSDQEFVRSLASTYGLVFETCDLDLGSDASEERARTERYAFLDSLVVKYNANGIILAHHSDDIIETAVINFIRGTGRRGLSSLGSTKMRTRPLLHMAKADIIDYAKAHNLTWVEDETNDSHKYLRNRVRSKINEFSPDQKQEFATHLQKIRHTNTVLDIEIAKMLQYKLKGKFIISRSWFVKLPHDLCCEIMHAVLGKIGVRELDRQLVERLVVALKVARPGTKVDVDKNIIALITKRSMRLISRETQKTHNLEAN
jgi:tRNA(Ile)-lysidine synthetase-like protein